MDTIDRTDLTKFVKSVGGLKHVAGRLLVSTKTVTSCFDKRTFTASWYQAFCDLADEAGRPHPPLSLFNMQELQASEPVAPAEAIA